MAWLFCVLVGFEGIVAVQAFQAGSPGNEFWVIHVYGTPYEVRPSAQDSNCSESRDIDSALLLGLLLCCRWATLMAA